MFQCDTLLPEWGCDWCCWLWWWWCDDAGCGVLIMLLALLTLVCQSTLPSGSRA